MFVIGGRVMKRMHGSLKAIGAAALIVVAGVAWWLISPLFIDKEVNEAIPTATQAMQADLGSAKQSEKPMAAKETVVPEAAMKSAVKFSGSFVDGEPKHYAKGNVFTAADGDKTILRIEELDATNGPDLHLFLAKPGSKTAEGINLGKLKGNKGSQNYTLPDEVDLSIYSKVVIYCKQFSVDFGYADLKKM